LTDLSKHCVPAFDTSSGDLLNEAAQSVSD